MTRYNHNHLRITRIIRSLRVLGLENEAVAFFKALKEQCDDQPDRVSHVSVSFWSKAVSRPLYLAPEDDEDLGDGQDFLYEYEKGKMDEQDGNRYVYEANKTEREIKEANLRKKIQGWWRNAIYDRAVG